MNALILGMIRNLSGIWVVGRKSRGISDLFLDCIHRLLAEAPTDGDIIVVSIV